MRCTGTAFAAPTTLAATAGLGRPTALPQAEFVPGRVLVRFKHAQLLQRLAGLPPGLPGVSFRRALGAGLSSRAAAAATLASEGAVHLFSITDGSSVHAKVAQLRKLSGLLPSCAAHVLLQGSVRLHPQPFRPLPARFPLTACRPCCMCSDRRGRA